MAAVVFTLAEKTGWDMDKILWKIPISILNQANHVFLWQAGAHLRRGGKAKMDNIMEMAKAIGVEL